LATFSRFMCILIFLSCQRMKVDFFNVTFTGWPRRVLWCMVAPGRYRR
jgi:hypothetical protein